MIINIKSIYCGKCYQDADWEDGIATCQNSDCSLRGQRFIVPRELTEFVPASPITDGPKEQQNV